MKRAKAGPGSGRKISRMDALSVARFSERYVVKTSTGCWEWAGSLFRGGYGQAYVPRTKRSYPAHRVSWAIANGGLRAGVLVLHSCDNPRCVNPDHLRLGSQKDNVKDMVSRGRAWLSVVNCRACGVPLGEGPRMGRRCVGCASKAKRLSKEERRRRDYERRVKERVRRHKAIVGIDESVAASVLGRRDLDILAANFGVWGFTKPEKMSDIGRRVGLSRERIRQLIVRACRKLGCRPRTFWGR